jgi:hypothetical protein
MRQGKRSRFKDIEIDAAEVWEQRPGRMIGRKCLEDICPNWAICALETLLA